MFCFLEKQDLIKLAGEYTMMLFPSLHKSLPIVILMSVDPKKEDTY